MAVHAASAHTLNKGETAMPNVVEEYKIGGSTIQIADDYVRTDPEEIERILDDMHRAGWKIVQSCRERGEDL
mgnify:CR=1 FL=1